MCFRKNRMNYWLHNSYKDKCWGMHIAQVAQGAAALELRVELLVGAPSKGPWTAMPGTCGLAKWLDTQRQAGANNTQHFPSLDCKRMNSQEFLCSSSILGVIQFELLFSYLAKNKSSGGSGSSETLLLVTWGLVSEETWCDGVWAL